MGACMQDPEADFRAPTVSASCTPGSNYGEVTLTIQVSNKHFKDCGFWYGTSSDLSDKKSLPVSGISGQSTGEARLTGLETGITYYYQAYVNSGRTSVTSSILHFTLDDVMNVDTDGFVVSYPETDLQVRVETTLPITVDLGGADWIQETRTKGLETYNKVFHISANTQLEDRTATIRIFTDNGIFNKEIPVAQSGCPISIPDEAFKAYMVANFDKNGDGEIVVDEAQAIERIDIVSDDIVTLKGIEYCSHLKSLKCVGTEAARPNGSGKLSEADVTQCQELEEVYLYFNALTSLDVSQCPNLRILSSARNILSSIDITSNPELKELNIDNNLLKKVNITQNPKIESLWLQGNPMEQLPDMSALPLKSLHLSGMVSGQPADFLTHFPDLESVNFSGYDGATLDLSKNTKLRDVWCYDMGVIQILDLSAAPGLKNLYCKAYDNSGWNKNLKAVYVHSGVVFETLEKNESTEIYYTDGNNHLSISPSSFEVDYKETTITVTVDSNLDVASDLGDTKWIYAAGQSGNTISFKVSRNYTTDDRSASFIIRTGNGQLEREVKVTQTGGPIDIPDAVFKQYMVEHFDQDRDGEITPKEALAVESIDITTDDITSLKGIEFCPKLRYLKCVGIDGNSAYGSGKLAYVDVTHCPELEELVVYQNLLKELDVTQCPKLRNLHPARNLLSTLDVSHNPELTHIGADYNLLKTIDLSNKTKLTRIDVSNNQITAIDLSECINLKEFLIWDNNLLENLDISKNPELGQLNLQNNKITSLDLSHNPKIYYLNLQGNPLKQLPDFWSLPLKDLHLSGLVKGQPADFLSHFPDLKSVNFDGYDGTTIDLSQNTKLEEVWCSSLNKIKVLDLSASPKLRKLYCNTWGANSFSVYLHTDVQLEDFDKDADTKFYYTDGNDHLTVTPSSFELDYKENVFTVTVDCNLDVTTDMGDVQWVSPTTIAGQPKNTLAFKAVRNYTTESRSATFRILAGGGKLQKEITVNQGAGPIEIPDAAFKRYMVNHFDKDGDGEITPKEASAITYIDIVTDEIVTLKGIEYCSSLRALKCIGTDGSQRYGSGKLAYVDLTHCPDLEELVVYQNELTELDLSGCPKLRHLHPARNLLTKLDVSHNPELDYLWADNNLLQEIDLSHNPNLRSVALYSNKLTALDVSHNSILETLEVGDNQIQSISLPYTSQLKQLYVNDNQIKSIDLSNNSQLEYLHVENNLLNSIDVSHNGELIRLKAYSNKVSTIDVSNNLKLEHLSIANNQISQLDLSKNPKLIDLHIDGNKITKLDLSNNPKITHMNIQGNPLECFPDIWTLPLEWLWAHGMVSGLPSDFLTHFPDMVSCNISGYDGASLDLSKNTKLKGIWCYGMPNIEVLDISNSPDLNQLHTSGSDKLKTVYVHTGVTFEGLEKDDKTEIVYK